MEYINNFVVSLLITLVGFFLSYFFTRSPRLIYYYGAITEIPFSKSFGTKSPKKGTDIAPDKNEPISIRSHTIVISNQGNASAHNVRIGHYFLPPMHAVSPPLNIQNEKNEQEILVPILCPAEFFIISYLYPTTNHFGEVNAYLKCDEGKAEMANLQDARIRSPFLILVMRGIFFTGVFAVIYFTLKLSLIVYKLYIISNTL